MPYTRIWVHLIWSTKNREPVLSKELRETIFQHIQDNAKEKKIFLDSIGGYIEHVHTLVALKADQSISKVAQLIKGESSHWVNEEKLTPKKFEWQDEYIAVSVSESVLEKVRAYIKGQEEHHRKKSFAEEYQEFVSKYGFEHEG